jgi:hypothetical protein
MSCSGKNILEKLRDFVSPFAPILLNASNYWAGRGKRQSSIIREETAFLGGQEATPTRAARLMLRTDRLLML